MYTETTHHTGADSCCPTCEINPFAYTNYWQAKLMLPSDFIDEQRYHIDKMRLHNQRLHGWGVVCGLQVVADTNPACRDRFVTVQPGMAIDCCGHEIVVAEPVRIDITRLPSYAALAAAGAYGSQTLQLCIRYRECGIDMIPVLYDDCAWDTDRCAPNKIAETFDFDVLSPDEEPVEGGHSHVVTLGLIRTIGINRATRMAAHTETDRLYIATAPIPGTNSFGDLFQLTLGSEAIRSAADLEGKVAALGVSPDGARVYVLRGNDDNPPNAVVDLYDANAIDETPVNSKPLGIALGDYTGLVVTPSGRVVVLADDNLVAMNSTLGIEHVLPHQNMRCIAAGLSDELVYIGADSGEVTSVDCDAPAPAVKAVHTLTGKPAIVDIAVIPAPPDGFGGAPADELVVLTDAHNVVLVSAGPDEKTVAVDAGVSRLGAAADGRRAVVAGTAGAQVVNIASLRTGKSGVRAPFAVGAGIAGGAGDVLVGPEHTYLAYPGDAAADPGGVAVLGTIGLLDCDDLLWKSSQTCPTCDTPGCIVLATMLEYDPGDRLVDKGTAAAESTDVEIDNRLGRQLLPSTSTLTELIECLLNRPGGSGDGIPGEDGAPGAAGTPGAGLEKDLVRINAISWIHGGTARPIEIAEGYFGFAIGFTGKVQTAGLDDHIFRVRIEHATPPPAEGNILTPFLRCRCDIRGLVVPIDAVKVGDLITAGTRLPDGTEAEAVAFLVDRQILGHLFDYPVDTLIELHGDFVLDTEKEPRAIDAEFVRAAFQTGDGPDGSEFGLQGGLFESWFTFSHIHEPSPIGRVLMNVASRDELKRIPGIGDALSQRIVDQRAAAGRYADEDDFLARVSPVPQWSTIRDHIDFTPLEG